MHQFQLVLLTPLVGFRWDLSHWENLNLLILKDAPIESGSAPTCDLATAESQPMEISSQTDSMPTDDDVEPDASLSKDTVNSY